MLAIVRRRLFLVVLTAVAIGTLAYVLAGLRPVAYTADSVLIVPSGSGGTGPGAANEALSLANTYAELIPRDADVLLAVATGLQVPVVEVRQRLTVRPIGSTALLQVSYESADRAQSVAGSRTTAESVLGGVTTADTVPRGSVRQVSLADDEGVTVVGGVSRSTIPIGVVLGLAVGAMLAVAAERANRRVDAPHQVAAVLNVPVLDLDTASPARRVALLKRWREFGPTDRATLVAVTGVNLDHAHVSRVCDELALGQEGTVAAPEGPASSSAALAKGGTVVLVPAGVPVSGQPNEDVTSNADLVVLLVPMSVQLAAVHATVEELADFGGRRPAYALTTGQVRPGSTPSPRKRARTAPAVAELAS